MVVLKVLPREFEDAAFTPDWSIFTVLVVVSLDFLPCAKMGDAESAEVMSQLVLL